MIKSAYISCPLSIPSVDLEAVIKKVRECNLNNLHYYGRGTAYDTNVYDAVIDKANAFILILPGMVWSVAVKDLTAGCRREYGRAMIDTEKQLFIAYKRMNGQIGIYQAITRNGIIRGVTDSVNVFHTAVADGNRHTAETAACPTPAQQKVQSKLKDYFGIGDDWDDLPAEAVPNKPKEVDRPAGVEDVNMYDPKVNINIFNFARSLYHSKYGISATNFHKEVVAFAESERQKAKATKLAEAYDATQQSLAKLLEADYEKAMYQQSERKYQEESMRYKGLNYHELLKKHLEHRTPVSEQPLAMLLPKEAMAPKEGDKVDSNGYTVEFKNGVWEWEIKNPNYIDERLLMFF